MVMGGTNPGHTTDAVAIRFAIASDAKKCIIATNVPRVFDEDPKQNPKAQSHDFLTHTSFLISLALQNIPRQATPKLSTPSGQERPMSQE